MEIRRADVIADALEELIFTGDFQDGDRLDEIQLAARFDVSRTPIREALQRLVTSGMAEQLPRRGVFVRQPGPLELIDMFETMAEIEAACGRLAAIRITEEALDRLREANRKCQAAIDTEDAEGFYRENQVFHHQIYTSCGNSHLEKLALNLHRRLKPYRRAQVRLRGRMAQSMAEHEAVVDALEGADQERAGAVLRDHVAVQGEKFHHLMANLKLAAV